jgi:hypothetical protein
MLLCVAHARHHLRIRSVFGLGEEREQVATQTATVVLRDPDGENLFERLGDEIRRRNHL